MNLIDIITQKETPGRCYKISDYIIDFGPLAFWRRLEFEGNNMAYARQGLAVKDWDEDLLWLRPWTIQESVPRNADTLRKQKLKLAGLPDWRKTRWVMVVNQEGKCILLDSRTHRHRDPNCPEAAALLERIDVRLGLASKADRES